MAIVGSAEAGLRAAPRATILQLRAPDMATADLEREAGRLVVESPLPILVNSRVDVALACDAAGVNLRERDIRITDARRLLGDRLVGRSVHSLESAVEAERDGADYVIFGPVWASTSHPGVAPVGIEALARVAQSVHIPVLAIGGLTEDRVAEVHRVGAAGYAAINMFS
jgi:thiamine-phosphate diphosphorylase